MEANRLKLITLPDDAIYSGSIEEIRKPLAEEVVPNCETRVFSKQHGFCRFDHSTGDDSNWTRDFGSCAAWTTHLPAETLPDPWSNSRRQANGDIDLRQFQQRSGLSHSRECESPQDEGSRDHVQDHVQDHVESQIESHGHEYEDCHAEQDPERYDSSTPGSIPWDSAETPPLESASPKSPDGEPAVWNDDDWLPSEATWAFRRRLQ